MADSIDLSDFSKEELIKLLNKAQKEMEKKQKTYFSDVRKELEQLARSKTGMSAEQVLFFDVKRKQSKTVGVPKYRNPNNPDQTWTGRGKRPGWIRDAVKKGASLEDFAIK